MNRGHGISTQSAPSAVALSRNTSRASVSMQLSQPPTWQNDMSSAQYDETPSFLAGSQHIEGTWQDPSDYLANAAPMIDTFQSQPHYTTNNMLEQQPSDPDMLSATSPHFTWSPASSTALNSPHYSTDQSDPMSLTSTNMSRDPTRSSFSSYGDHCLTGDLAMLRVKSDASFMSSSLSQSRHPAPVGAGAQYHYPHHQFVSDQDHSPLTTHVNPNHTSFESNFDAFNFNSAESMQPGESYAAPLMHRDFSSSSSSSNTSSRSHKRHRETLQQSQRSIAPALNQHSSTSNKHDHAHQQLNSAQMVKMKSENGEEKLYGVLSKNVERQKRTSVPKLICPHCNDHPDGFRGEHELQRHVSRAHSKIRKVWVCVDSSPDRSFLANCKACRTKKRYGAYYNAAAQ